MKVTSLWISKIFFDHTRATKFTETCKFRQTLFKFVRGIIKTRLSASLFILGEKPRVWHARFEVRSVRYNCGITMFLQMEASHEADVSGADLPRTIAHGRHILKAASRGFAGIPVRFLEGGGGGDACSLFLLASQPKRSQGERKWMENWWTNNNRCPLGRVETLTRGKFITVGRVCRLPTFVCRPGTRNLCGINTALCKKMRRVAQFRYHTLSSNHKFRIRIEIFW